MLPVFSFHSCFAHVLNVLRRRSLEDKVSICPFSANALSMQTRHVQEIFLTVTLPSSFSSTVQTAITSSRAGSPCRM